MAVIERLLTSDLSNWLFIMRWLSDRSTVSPFVSKQLVVQYTCTGVHGRPPHLPTNGMFMPLSLLKGRVCERAVLPESNRAFLALVT